MLLFLKSYAILAIICYNAQALIRYPFERDQNSNAQDVSEDIAGTDTVQTYIASFKGGLENTRHNVLGLVNVKLYEGYDANVRRKRMAKVISVAIVSGFRAVKTLLKGAKLTARSPDTNVYVKPGGFKDAFEDFIAVRPNNIQETGIHMRGEVGDRIISLERGWDGDAASMVIQRLPSEDKRFMTMDVIVYKTNDPKTLRFR